VSSPSSHSDSARMHEGPTDKIEIWTRITPGEEYIKLIVDRGKVVGAMLIGDIDLAETFENIILSKIDVSSFGVDLLNPGFDIDDYFD
jgi:pyridine nucleotide-disulfide oxidoreductase domain-containing protein 1